MSDVLGVINLGGARRADYLYRVSLKCVIRNSRGEVLVVKESDRDNWDLPGGGMDHGESIKSVIARELAEEVNLHGDFDYKAIAVEEPKLVTGHNWYQIRLIFEVIPHNLHFKSGSDVTEVIFKDPAFFEHSDRNVERKIYQYSQLQ